MRHYYLYDLDNGGGFRRADESRLLFEYMQKHDAAASALPIYLDVVNRYPNTRAARDALYTAAVCHDRLASYNNYWRAIYDRGGFAGERKVDYKDVRRVYPDYRYPLGTNGWEPATRTVNGGLGAAAEAEAAPVTRPPGAHLAQQSNAGRFAATGEWRQCHPENNHRDSSSDLESHRVGLSLAVARLSMFLAALCVAAQPRSAPPDARRAGALPRAARL